MQHSILRVIRLRFLTLCIRPRTTHSTRWHFGSSSNIEDLGTAWSDYLPDPLLYKFKYKSKQRVTFELQQITPWRDFRPSPCYRDDDITNARAESRISLSGTTDSTSGTTNTTSASDTTDTTTNLSTTLADFAPLVDKLRHDVEGGLTLPRTIGTLKKLEKAITALDVGTTAQGVQLLLELADIAMLVLPDDTRKVLESSGCGSDAALELVRRNLVQLPTLAKKLYTVTSEELEADADLMSLHVQIGTSLELYGALVTHGINPKKRPRALTLTQKFSSLSEMRRTSWFKLGRLIGINRQNENADEVDNESDEEEHAGKAPSLQQADGAVGPKQENNETVNPKVLGAAIPARLAKAVCPLLRGEMVVLQDLYAAGNGTAPIRRQALDFGLGLHAADQLEENGIQSADKLTEANIRILGNKLHVPQMSPEGISAAMTSMVSKKKRKKSATLVVTAEADDDNGNQSGAYSTYEELVSSAGGGVALYGVNFFPNEVDVTLKPYAPLLAKPTCIEMAGASASFEASVLHSTETSMAAAYTKTTENGGISVAQASTTSWGVNGSVSGFGGAASAELSADSESKQTSDGKTSTTNAFSANNKKTTTTVTMVETVMCPMKSFRIPVSKMTMSEEAFESAGEVDTLLKAGQFLDTFGSHVSNGRHLLGGIFFRTITMTSESEVDTSTLLARASTQLEQSRSCDMDVGASAEAGNVGISAKASASFGKATSSGVVKFHSSVNSEGSTTEDSRAMFQTYVRSMGPNVATPELFAEALFTNNSSWTVIDRGPLEALVPITEVMENTLSSYDVDFLGKAKLENAINLVKVAWKQRARVWKPLEGDPAVPVSLRNMIGRSFEIQDAHDQIGAAIIDLFEVLHVSSKADISQAANVLSSSVVATAEEMKSKPAGQADFFDTLQKKITAAHGETGVVCSLHEGTPQRAAAARSAKRLSSTDWNGFDLIWNTRHGTLSIQNALDEFLKFEKAKLKFGESITVDSPLASVNERYRLEVFKNKLQVARTDGGEVVDVLFESIATLGENTAARFSPTGAFVLEQTTITGYTRTERKQALWTAPSTDGYKGSYARMQNDGSFVVFSRRGQKLWSTSAIK